MHLEAHPPHFVERRVAVAAVAAAAAAVAAVAVATIAAVRRAAAAATPCTFASDGAAQQRPRLRRAQRRAGDVEELGARAVAAAQRDVARPRAERRCDDGADRAVCGAVDRRRRHRDRGLLLVERDDGVARRVRLGAHAHAERALLRARDDAALREARAVAAAALRRLCHEAVPVAVRLARGVDDVDQDVRVEEVVEKGVAPAAPGVRPRNEAGDVLQHDGAQAPPARGEAERRSALRQREPRSDERKRDGREAVAHVRLDRRKRLCADLCGARRERRRGAGGRARLRPRARLRRRLRRRLGAARRIKERRLAGARLARNPLAFSLH